MEEGGGASGTALAAAGATAQPREPPPPTALDVRAEAHIKVPSACEIKKMKVPELKSLLSRLGKPDDGLKKALVDRLLDAAAAAAVPAAATGADADAAAARHGCSTGRDASSTSARPQRAAAAAAAGAIAAGLDAAASGATAHAARATRTPALSAAQSTAMRGWLVTSILSTGTGRWPANGESRADIAEKLRELGVSAEQAKKALAKLRLERRAEIANRGDAKPPREVYKEMIVDGLEKDEIFDAAIARLVRSPYMEEEAGSSFDRLLRVLREEAGVRHAVYVLLDGYAEASAASWAVGGTGAPLAFVVGRWQSILPAFQNAVVRVFEEEVAWLVWVEQSDVRQLATWLEGEMYVGYGAALEPTAKPPITNAVGRAAFSAGEEASIYYIAGWLLATVRDTLAPKGDDSADAVWCSHFVSCCSLPASHVANEKEQKTWHLPSEKVDSETHGGLLYATEDFYAFACTIEAVYLSNLTPAHLDAYPTTLAAQIKKFLLAGAVVPRRVLEERVLPAMDGLSLSPIPSRVYPTMINKYAMMRVKDLGRVIHDGHIESRKGDATAGGVTTRASCEAAAASSRARGKRTVVAATVPAEPCPIIGRYLAGRRINCCFGGVVAEAEDSDEGGEMAGEEIGLAWCSGLVLGVDERSLGAYTGPVANVRWDNGDDDSLFALRDKEGEEKRWQGTKPGSWYCM